MVAKNCISVYRGCRAAVGLQFALCGIWNSVPRHSLNNSAEIEELQCTWFRYKEVEKFERMYCSFPWNDLWASQNRTLFAFTLPVAEDYKMDIFQMHLHPVEPVVPIHTNMSMIQYWKCFPNCGITDQNPQQEIYGLICAEWMFGAGVENIHYEFVTTFSWVYERKIVETIAQHAFACSQCHLLSIKVAQWDVFTVVNDVWYLELHFMMGGL